MKLRLGLLMGVLWMAVGTNGFAALKWCDDNCSAQNNKCNNNLTHLACHVRCHKTNLAACDKNFKQSNSNLAGVLKHASGLLQSGLCSSLMCNSVSCSFEDLGLKCRANCEKVKKTLPESCADALATAVQNRDEFEREEFEKNSQGQELANQPEETVIQEPVPDPQPPVVDEEEEE